MDRTSVLQPAQPSTRWCRVPSPAGELTLTAGATALTGLRFTRPGEADRWTVGLAHEPGWFDPVVAQLEEYFAGHRTAFDVALAPTGSAFQLAVWAALCTIPYGETRSYGQIARAIDRATGSRAVGAANGRNPISIIVPCHRVIGADGSLTGYGGGMDRKQLLLGIERPSLLAV